MNETWLAGGGGGKIKAINPTGQEKCWIFYKITQEKTI